MLRLLCDSRPMAVIMRAADRGLSHVFKFAERAIASGRRGVGRAADRLQLWLRVLEVRLDPSTEQWLNEMHSAVAKGDIHKALESQPSVEAIVEQHRTNAAA